jgi:high affinity Mn2+ porin
MRHDCARLCRAGLGYCIGHCHERPGGTWHNESGSAGLSIQGDFWHRPNDTVGLAGVINAASRVQQQYLAAGGLGILAGDGRLNYGLEQTLETYYKFQIWKSISATADYQYVADPAYNRDRGPVSVVSMRLHWEF